MSEVHIIAILNPKTDKVDRVSRSHTINTNDIFEADAFVLEV
jgi:hypothetical protein